jgi:hypothetical protein
LNIITIDKSKIPYEFQYEIKGKVWTLVIKEHYFSKIIRVDLIDELGNIVVNDWTCKFGIPLFYPYMQDDNLNINQEMPQAYFTFQSVDGKEYPITFENLETNVFLTVQNVV